MVKLLYSAVGMPWRVMKALAKSLELSSCAAAWGGPKILSPACLKSSTTPSASGASGPTTVRPMLALRERDQIRDRGQGDVAELALARRAGVAGRDEDFRNPARLRDFP